MDIALGYLCIFVGILALFALLVAVVSIYEHSNAETAQRAIDDGEWPLARSVLDKLRGKSTVADARVERLQFMLEMRSGTEDAAMQAFRNLNAQTAKGSIKEKENNSLLQQELILRAIREGYAGTMDERAAAQALDEAAQQPLINLVAQISVYVPKQIIHKRDAWIAAVALPGPPPRIALPPPPPDLAFAQPPDPAWGWAVLEAFRRACWKNLCDSKKPQVRALRKTLEFARSFPVGRASVLTILAGMPVIAFKVGIVAAVGSVVPAPVVLIAATIMDIGIDTFCDLNAPLMPPPKPRATKKAKESRLRNKGTC